MSISPRARGFTSRRDFVVQDFYWISRQKEKISSFERQQRKTFDGFVENIT